MPTSVAQVRESAALPRIVDPAFAMSDTERPAIPPVAAVHLLVSNRPRVLLLTTYYAPLLGGVETHARQLATHLRAHGFGVQIVTKRVAADHPGVERIDDIVVHRVSPTGERRGAGKWLATPFMLRKILELRDEFDVLVCVDYRGIGLAAVVAGRWLRRPVLVQAGTAGALAGPTLSSAAKTGVRPEGWLVRLVKIPVRAIYRRADHFVCIARDIEAEAIDAGIPPARVHYLPHGVNLTRFHAVDAAE
ncbi:MAG: glycosyltransferase, partial [Vicinamibacterales bacterium]